MGTRSRHGFELAGWLIFVASACFFLAATIKSGDVLSIAGSGLFLAACFVFMVPLLAGRQPVAKTANVAPETKNMHRQSRGRCK